MENQPSDWRESVWRRPLTDAEKAALIGQPDLELEARLTQSLAKIPDVPVASNFTARVMSAIEREEARPARRWIFDLNWSGFLPRLIATAAIVAFAGVGWERYEVRVQRVLLAKTVAQVTTDQPVPSVEVLKNFDAIQRMSQPVTADKDLLALMQ
ncbi:MAG: hypothetical protein ABSE48_19575 [Verrucomicrobiota bacterium]|jgi:hypothetical protein